MPINKDLCKRLAAAGYQWQYTASKHLLITGHGVRYYTGSTPSDARAADNLWADLRRLRRAAEKPSQNSA